MEIGESSHKHQIKDEFNSSNKTGNDYTQMINFYLRCDAFTVWKANLEALSKRKQVSAVADTTAGHCQLKFISSQLGKGRQRVRDFQGLLDAIADEASRECLKNATLRFLRSRSISIK